MNTIAGVSVVGTFREDSNGRVHIEGWTSDTTYGVFDPRRFDVESLKEIAITHGTYEKVDHIEVKPLEYYGTVIRDETGNIVEFIGKNTV